MKNFVTTIVLLLCGIVSMAQLPTDTSNIVAYYPFNSSDTGHGATYWDFLVRDISGHNHNLINFEDSTSLANDTNDSCTSDVMNCYKFSGSITNYLFSTDTFIDMTKFSNGQTISIWVNILNYSHYEQDIISQSVPTTDISYKIFAQDSQIFYIVKGIESVPPDTLKAYYTPNTWINLVVTRPSYGSISNENMYFYNLGSVPVDTRPISWFTFPGGNYKLQVGSSSSSGNFNGYMNNLAIYDTEKTTLSGLGCVNPTTLISNNYHKSNKINIYPVPANNYLNVECVENSTFKVFDLTGKNILTSKSSKIDVSMLTNGEYILQIQSESNIEHKKFTVFH